MLLHRQLKKIHDEITRLGSLVEESYTLSTEALFTNNADIEKRADELESQIDEMEVEVEEECLHCLALYQPVAHDLREVISVIKVNEELERIGDHAIKIARFRRKCQSLLQDPTLCEALKEMADSTRSIIHIALQSLLSEDSEMARGVHLSDDRVDDIHRNMHKLVSRAIATHQDSAADIWLPALAVSRHFERIADHGVNIAKIVVYLDEGRIIRHQQNT